MLGILVFLRGALRIEQRLQVRVLRERLLRTSVHVRFGGTS